MRCAWLATLVVLIRDVNVYKHMHFRVKSYLEMHFNFLVMASDICDRKVCVCGRARARV